MKRLLQIFVITSFIFTPILSKAQKEDHSAKVEALLSKMTLEEKIGQMNQYTGFFDPTGPAPKGGDAKDKYDQVASGKVGSMLNVRGVEEVRALQKVAVEKSRLGIPLIFAFDVIHGFKTTAPIPLAEAASWDLEAIEKSARVAAIEASAAGLNWTFAPMVDITRDARWGRVMEGAGEDAFLGSKIAVARVKGFQGDDLSTSNTIAACAKHFAGYGFAEAGKDYAAADVGLSTLHNVILPPFKAVAEIDVATFMNSFNTLNGIPATADKYLQRDILKGDWNYNGFVVSDWGSIGELIPHGVAKDGKHAAEVVANAGCDMDMESKYYHLHLKELVAEGKVKESLIDDAVRRILKIKFDLGLFDDPYKYCDAKKEKELMNHPDHHASVLDMAKKSIVLLKNQKGLLPLKKEGLKIALIGPLANEKNSPLGNWRLASDDNTAVSVLEGMNAVKGNQIDFHQGVKLLAGGKVEFVQELKINETDETGIAEAVNAARTADVVVMVLGEHGYQSGEGRSRMNIDLPGLQQRLLEKVFEVNKKVVLVLNTGRPLALPWASENIPAILNAWHLGSQTGHAVTQVLYGDYNPSGKLPMTFPRDKGQLPIYYNAENTGRPGPEELVFWAHYIDGPNAPIYPFGHGLSYTNFQYSDLSVVKSGKNIEVKVNVTNTGKVMGEEVVQVYIRDIVGSVARPIKELKGFEKVAIAPREMKTLNFTLTEKELGFYNNQSQFVVEPGEFKITVGGSSIGGLEAMIVY